MKQVQLLLILVTLIPFKSSGQFKEGHYYRKDGTKETGFIRFNFGGDSFSKKSDGDCSISFKTDSKGKEIELTTNDICCFVIEKDSFAIIKKFRLNSESYYPQDFAEVIEVGKLNLYRYYTTAPTEFGVRTATVLVIEKDGKVDRLSKKKFKKLLPLYLADTPELLKKIESGQLRYDDAEQIVKMYNAEMRMK